MRTVTTYKAEPQGTEDNRTTINISQVCPRAKTLERQDEIFQQEADALCDALYGSLPGGVFDRLLGAMLKVKSSHFIVSHK